MYYIILHLHNLNYIPFQRNGMKNKLNIGRKLDAT